MLENSKKINKIAHVPYIGFHKNSKLINKEILKLNTVLYLIFLGPGRCAVLKIFLKTER